MRKVIVAFESGANSARISEALESGGVAECVVCRSAAEVKRLVHKQGLNVILCGFKLPDETGQELFQDLPDRCVMLMIAPQNRLELCEDEGIFKLTSPVSRGDLLASVRMLLQIQRGRYAGSSRPHRTEEEKNLVEHAKVTLMDRHGMTEEQAHRFLQKQSMDTGARLAEVARVVLSGQ